MANKKSYVVPTRLSKEDFEGLVEETQIQGKRKSAILRRALKLYLKIVAFLEEEI